MKRRLLPAFTLALALTILVTGPGYAGPRWGFEVGGGWGSYDMDDFNASLRDFNGTTGTDFDEIHDGGAATLSLRVWPRERVLLRLGLEGMSARTKDADLTFDVGTRAVVASATYFFPSTAPLKYGLGLGLAWIGIWGQLDGSSLEFDASGEGTGVQGTGEVLVPIRGSLAATGTAGYRLAGVHALKLEGQSSDMSPNYSGVVLRLGLAYEQPRTTP